ncbi:MAG: hypothetical protein VW999_03580 [Alphaproteobacteria bacterium]
MGGAASAVAFLPTLDFAFGAAFLGGAFGFDFFDAAARAFFAAGFLALAAAFLGRAVFFAGAFFADAFFLGAFFDAALLAGRRFAAATFFLTALRGLAFAAGFRPFAFALLAIKSSTPTDTEKPHFAQGRRSIGTAPQPSKELSRPP